MGLEPRCGLQGRPADPKVLVAGGPAPVRFMGIRANWCGVHSPGHESPDPSLDTGRGTRSWDPTCADSSWERIC